MQSSKRTLRSNEIIIPQSGILDTELDLSFSLQYPHFLKRDGNKLQIMIQRRKKYKNRTILGYKTLATGCINMSQVLQCTGDRMLSLYSEVKEISHKVAQISVLSLSSQPVDHDDSTTSKHATNEDVDISDDELEGDGEDWSNDELSDSEPTPEDEGGHRRTRKTPHSLGARTGLAQFRQQRNIKQKFVALLKRFKMSEEVDSEQDQEVDAAAAAHAQEIAELFDELEDLSDSGPEMDNISVLSTPKPKLRPFFAGKSNPGLNNESADTAKEISKSIEDSVRRTNDSEGHMDSTDSEDIVSNGDSLRRKGFLYSDVTPTPPTPLSASPVIVGPVISSPRCSSLREKTTTQRIPPKYERSNSTGHVEVTPLLEPRKALLDQLSSVLASDDCLPDNFILINTNDHHGQMLSQLLKEPHHRVICTSSSADVKATISFIVNRIQKFCNTNSKAPAPIKIVIAGGDSYFNLVLRPYVEQFSAKSHDWQNYIKFLFIPLGNSSLGKFLGSLDASYCNLFLDSTWKDCFEKADSQCTDPSEISERVSQYLTGASHVVQLPIAEAMVTYKGKGTEEDSSQIFLPFVIEVRIGPVDASTVSSSVDLEDSVLPGQAVLSSSPPLSGGTSERSSHTTPPNSPSITSHQQIQATPTGQSSSSSSSTVPLMSPSSTVSPMMSSINTSSSCNFMELLELQLDYWTTAAGPSKTDHRDSTTDREPPRTSRKENKTSLKTSFKSVQVSRLTPPNLTASVSADYTPGLTLIVVIKEKKQKIMRIGKKSKDTESKSQVVDSISRIICTSKSQNNPFTVYIDSTELASVKFFQLSSQWQTHVKHIPVLVFNSTATADHP